MAPMNPLLETAGLPRFDRITPDLVVSGVRAALKTMEANLIALESSLTDLHPGNPPHWDNTCAPLARIGRPFARSWSAVCHLVSVMNSDALRAAHQEIMPEVVAFGLRFAQSKPVYGALKKIAADHAYWESLPRVKQRIIEDRLRDAELAGVGLEGREKERFLSIANELSKLETNFSNRVLDATKAWGKTFTDPNGTEGWPEVLKQMTAQSFNAHKAADAPEATAEKGPWRLTLDGPPYAAFSQHHRLRADRQEAYLAFVTRASENSPTPGFDNGPAMAQILQLRQEKAELLGFACYADLSLSTKMAENQLQVRAMYDELVPACKEPAKQELAELQKFAEQKGFAGTLAPWDIPFYAERLREEKYRYTADQTRPYFPFARVLDGLFALCEKLHAVTFEKAAHGTFPTWHADVDYYRIRDEAGSEIAGLYLDPYARPGLKRGGAWVSSCLGRYVDGAESQLPVCHVVCNGTPPSAATPSLMSFDEITTLFHEFGHALQSTLTTVDEADAAGLGGIEWDAVEIASQFMENWCYHRPVLLGMSSHFKTGEKLPQELFEKICAAKTFRAGSAFVRQLHMGLCDLELHSTYDPARDGTPNDVAHRLAAAMLPLAPVPQDRYFNAFTHIFSGGYCAGYYSYKWSEVLSADAFAAFEEVGLDNDAAVRQLGRRYRDTLLAMGGGEHPGKVYQLFRGKPASTAALLRHNGLR